MMKHTGFAYDNNHNTVAHIKWAAFEQCSHVKLKISSQNICMTPLSGQPSSGDCSDGSLSWQQHGYKCNPITQSLHRCALLRLPEWQA